MRDVAMRRFKGRMAVGIAGALVSLAALAPGASAAVDVTDSGDGGAGCTLREAVKSANDDLSFGGCIDALPVDTWDEIELDAGSTYTLTGLPGDDANSSGDLDIADSVLFYANGPGTTVSGGDADRVFHVLGGGSTLGLDSFKVIGGNVLGDGGAVKTVGGPVNVFQMTFEDNKALGSGGAIDNGASLVTIADSAFIGNTAINGVGGAIALNGDTFSRADRSYFTQNSADDGGGALNMTNNAAFQAYNSTIHDNTAESGGGGLQVDNSAKNSYLFLSTLTDNKVTMPGSAAGLRVEAGGINPFISVFGTIVAANRSDGVPFNCSGTISSVPATGGGYSIDDGSSCALDAVPANGNLSSTDPKLAIFADYGGDTQTRALFSDSPALNAIPPAACDLSIAHPPYVSQDQREVTRPAGVNCDIGAFEGSIPAPVVTPPVTTTPPPATTPPTTTAPPAKKKCKKGRKLKKGKCVKKKKRK